MNTCTAIGSDPALAEAIAAAWRLNAPLNSVAPPDVQIDVVSRTGSTNSDLMHDARERAPALPRIRIALEQTAGRGRSGRSWQAPAGGALLLSIAVPLARPMVESAVTLACGVAVVEALRGERVPAQLKWPNDVLLEGRKLAGLLAELAIDGSGARTLVVGLGLNLVHPRQPRPGMASPAALADAMAIDDIGEARCGWSVRLAAAMLTAIRAVEREGFAPFAPRFDSLFLWRDQPVVVIDPQRAPGAAQISGTALGVDAAGRLRIDTGSEILAVSSGDVSLRARNRAAPDQA